MVCPRSAIFCQVLVLASACKERKKKSRGPNEGSSHLLHLNGDFSPFSECPDADPMFQICIFPERGVPKIGAHARVHRGITDPENRVLKTSQFEICSRMRTLDAFLTSRVVAVVVGSLGEHIFSVLSHHTHVIHTFFPLVDSLSVQTSSISS